MHAAKSSSCHRDHRDVARAANAREARLCTNVMRGQKAAHQPDVLPQTGACQLCSFALLGEALCFRHTTILGSCRDLTALAAPLPRRPYSISGLSDGCAAFSGPLGCRRRGLGKRTHRQEGMQAVCAGRAGSAVFLKYQNAG